MAKLIFLAAVVAAMVAISVAYGESAVSTQCQCQRELQESSLGTCQAFVDRQLNMVPAISQRPSQSTWITEEQKMWCCRQLQKISSGCRAAAIRSIVRKYEQDLEAAQQPQTGGPGYPAPGEPAEEPGYPAPGEPAKQPPQIEWPGYPAPCEPAPHTGGTGYPAPGEPAKQPPQIEWPGYPAPGEPAKQQPPQEGGQVHHGCPGQHTRNRIVVRQQPIGGFLPVGLPEEIARERLTRARQLVAQLPAQCGLEFGAFSSDQY